MSLIAGYSSDSDDGSVLHKEIPQLPNYCIEIAPTVDIQNLPSNQIISVDEAGLNRKRTFAGTIEKQFYDDATFKAGFQSFKELGYAKYNSDIVGSISNADKYNGKDLTELRPTKKQTREAKRKRSKKGKVSSIDSADQYKGPWAGYNDSDGSTAQEDDSEQSEAESEPESFSEAGAEVSPIAKEAKITTELFTSSDIDYQGRTYMHVPRDLDISLTKEPGSQVCFVPKKLIHEWNGHEGGVNKLQFFPNSGHLLLSCGNDGNIFLWDSFHRRQLLRGFYGHSKSVKDITFNSTGTEFLSCSYDKTIILWDTESGEIKNTIKLNSIPNVLKYNPNNENEFLVGLQNKKIEHYQLTTNKIIQTYDHHLGAINSITIVDDDRRFMTTSDDKSVRFWDWQINIPVKFISDPSQHSMPTAALHPSKKYVALQSMDNTIQVFSAKDKFKPNRKKTFTGHQCAGYGIGLAFSPDGKIIMSGDLNGFGYFWDWKTRKLVAKLKVDSKAITCIEANPQEVSKVAMAGLGGKLYYYE